MATRLAALGGWGLNLGCGGRPEKDWINHDATEHSPHVDVAWNLERDDWPKMFENVDTGEFLGRLLVPVKPGHRVQQIQFAKVKCRDVLEHIPPNLFFQTMNQIWHLTQPEGILEIQVPEFGSVNAIQDPTHWRGFHLDSFDILDPATSFGRKSLFYCNKPWTLLSKTRVPRSTVNLCFLLQRPK